jgi:hypothetical protein
LRRKRKAGERENHDREINNIGYCFHVSISLCEQTFRSRVSRREESQVLGSRRLADLTRRDSPPPRPTVSMLFFSRKWKNH